MISLDMTQKTKTIEIPITGFGLENGIITLQIEVSSYDLTGKTITAGFSPAAVESTILEVIDNVIQLPIYSSEIRYGVNHIQLNFRWDSDKLEQSPIMIWKIEKSLFVAEPAKIKVDIITDLIAQYNNIKNDYGKAEANRDALYSAAEGVRNGYYNDVEIERNNSYDAAEVARDDFYEVAEANRNTKVNELGEQINNLDAQKADQIDLDTTNTNVALKADKVYTDNQLFLKANKADIQANNLTYKESYDTLALLQTAYPTGDTYNHAVLADGLIYTYYNSAWVSTSIQANGTGVADSSVTVLKTDFATAGKNKYDKAKRSADTFISQTTGIATPNASYDASEYIPIVSGQTYTINKCRTYAIYDSAKVYVSGVDNSSYAVKTFTASADGYLRITSLKADVDITQIEIGTVATLYESFGTTIINLSHQNKSIKTEALEDNIRFDSYPFKSLATFTGSKEVELEIKKAVKHIEIYGANPTKKYCLGILQRNYSTYGTGAYIYECNEDGTTNKIVSFKASTPYAIPSGVTEYSLPEYQASGITAKLYVDWNMITDNKQYVMQHYDKSGLDYKTYKPIDVLIKLPVSIPAIVGKEINVYFDNVILCDNLNDYSINVEYTGVGGVQQNERFTCIPTVAGTFVLTINLVKNSVTVLTASTNVIVKAESVGNAVNKRGIIIGDSTTSSGIYTQELLNLFNNDVMDLTLLGTVGTAPNLHEGRAGWKAQNYIENASVGEIVNAFWNAGTSAFDFSYYMTQQGYSSVDVVGINLGINDLFTYADDISVNDEIANVLTRLDTMLNSIHAYNAAIKVAFMITIPPSKNQDAFGKNYGAGQTRWRYKRNNYLFMSKLIDKYKGREAESIYLVPINVNLDTENNMQTETVAVNSRNTKTIIRQFNGVHPATSGYYQIADVIYYWIKNQEV